jgi:hypothetical protein
MTTVPVICYRQLPGKRDISSSIVIPVLLPAGGAGLRRSLFPHHFALFLSRLWLTFVLSRLVSFSGEALVDGGDLKVAGWEKDSGGKRRPRVVSLADSMDPQK